MSFTLGKAKAIATLAATELGAIAIYFADNQQVSKWIAVGTAVFATLAAYAIPTTVTPNDPIPVHVTVPVPIASNVVVDLPTLQV